jgi:hypothetical protein
VGQGPQVPGRDRPAPATLYRALGSRLQRTRTAAELLAAVIEPLRHNELVGWSWLFSPHIWHLGAEATTPVRAYEFDATAVRLLCREEPAIGNTLAQWVGDVLAHRLRSARTGLLDLYAPYGADGRV